MQFSWLLVLLGAASTSLAAADALSQAGPVQSPSNRPVSDTEVGAAFEDAHIAQDVSDMSAMAPSSTLPSPRHRQEKAHLMKRMDRKSGKWTVNHPRYRLLEALWAYTRYRERHMAELDRWRSLYKSVSKNQMKTLEKVVGYKKKLDEMEDLIVVNAAICHDIVRHAMQFYRIDQKELDEHMARAEKDGRQADRVAVAQTLKHYVRDWADEGAKERNEAFPCILSMLTSIQSASPDKRKLSILLPGSGMGRLGHDVANLGGFQVTLNEWSMFMTTGYRYLSSQTSPHNLTFHPFIDAMSHHARRHDMLRRVSAPNIQPHPDVLLVEGDFTTAFNQHAAHFDVVVTHFFIDTARNLVAYLDTIARVLRPGGRWINFSPLLYGSAPLVQLCLDEIVGVVEDMGFVFDEVGPECGVRTFEGGKVRSKEAGYGFNDRGLTRHAYLAQVWMATRA